MKSNVAIWVPAKRSQGLGHFYRNYYFYEQLENAFYFFNEDLEYNVQERNKICISNNYSKIKSFLKNESVNKIILDHYFLPEELVHKLSQDEDFDVLAFYKEGKVRGFSAFINNNPFSVTKEYPFSKEKLSFIGSSFYGFRKEVEQYKLTEKKEGQVFVCFGGSDPFELSDIILDKLEKHKSYQVVLGVGCPKEFLNRVNRRFKELELEGEVHHHPTNFFELLATSELAILSSSTITYEASFLKTPFICVQTAENQDELVAYLSSKNIKVLTSDQIKEVASMSSFLGDSRYLDEEWGGDLAKLVAFLKEN